MVKLPMTALSANLKPTVRFKQRDQLLYVHRAYSVLRSNHCRITSGRKQARAGTGREMRIALRALRWNGLLLGAIVRKSYQL